MPITKEQKKNSDNKITKADTDTGSAESQITLFTNRINHLTGHLKVHKKDFSSQRSLQIMVGKRRRHLNYLIEIDITRYRKIIKELGIRK